MKSLEELNWEQFHIGDVFSVERPVARNKDNYEHGDVPFVASGAANNGVLKCCRPKNDETLDKRNCITVSPVDGSTFYQVFDFLGRGGAGSSVLLLRSPQNELLSGQFVSRMISQTCSKYTYGHMGSKESIKREIIQLPTYPDHSPDYQYMADYVERKSNDLRDRYCLYAKKRISEMGTPITVPPLNEKNWQTFIIKDIADVYSGHDIYAQERVNGKTPLVTAVGINNGVGYFVSNENNSKAEESISVVRNGASVGKAFYHKYSALYGNDCRRMKLKHSHSEFVNLFITQVIGMQNKAFSYGYTANLLRNIFIILGFGHGVHAGLEVVYLNHTAVCGFNGLVDTVALNAESNELAVHRRGQRKQLCHVPAGQGTAQRRFDQTE